MSFTIPSARIYQTRSDHLLNKWTSEWVINLLTGTRDTEEGGSGWQVGLGTQRSRSLQVTWERWSVNNFKYRLDLRKNRPLCLRWASTPSPLHFISLTRSNSFFLSIHFGVTLYLTAGFYFPSFFYLLASILFQFYYVPLMEDIMLNMCRRTDMCILSFNLSGPSLYTLQSPTKCLEIVETKYLMNAWINYHFLDTYLPLFSLSSFPASNSL